MSHIQAKHDLYAKQKSRLSYSFVWAQTMSVFCLESSEIMKPLKAINCFCTCSPSRTKLKALEDSAATFYPVSNVYVCFSLTIVFEVNCDMFMCLWYQRWFTEGLWVIQYKVFTYVLLRWLKSCPTLSYSSCIFSQHRVRRECALISSQNELQLEFWTVTTKSKLTKWFRQCCIFTHLNTYHISF